MRAAHGLVIVLALSIGTLAWVLVSHAGPEGAEDPAHPDRGALAPFEGEVPLAPMARVPGGAGRVVDLAVAGNGLAVLTRNHWYLHDFHAGDTLRGGFGDPTPGSPDWISRPVSIALDDDTVYILDAGRFAISIWDRGGVRRSEIHLWAGDELSFQPTQLLLGPAGELVVLSLAVDQDGTGRWEARAYHVEGARPVGVSPEGHPPGAGTSQGGDGYETVVALEGKARSFIFHRPYLAAHDGRLLGAMALSQEFFLLQPGSGSFDSLFQRPDPPLWYIPASQHRRYAGLLQRMQGAAAGLSQLPEFWPSVRGLTVREDGSFILAVTAGEDHQHLELLAPHGLPLRRFSLDGFRDPVFVHGGRAFLVREDLNETVIYEFIIRPE